MLLGGGSSPSAGARHGIPQDTGSLAVFLPLVFPSLLFALLNLSGCRGQKVWVVYYGPPMDFGMKKKKSPTLHAGDPWSMNTRTERVSCVRRITNRSSPVMFLVGFPHWVVRTLALPLRGTLAGHSLTAQPSTQLRPATRACYANSRQSSNWSAPASSPCRRVCSSSLVPWVAAGTPPPLRPSPLCFALAAAALRLLRPPSNAVEF